MFRVDSAQLPDAGWQRLNVGSPPHSGMALSAPTGNDVKFYQHSRFNFGQVAIASAGLRRHRVFRHYALAVKFAIRLRSIVAKGGACIAQPALLDSRHLHAAGLLEDVGSWNDFDIFRVEELSGGMPLQCVGLKILHASEALAPFHVPMPKFRTFLARIEGLYRQNPYHKSTHAADVTQAVYCLLGGSFRSCMSAIEHMTALMAAICHDVGHPGVTNAFRVAQRDESAVTYNDKSVNENMHSALTYQTLMTEECNWLCNVSVNEDATIRKLFIEIVLNTDPVLHFQCFKAFEAELEKNGTDATSWDSVSHLLPFFVHAADVSNVTRPVPKALRWAALVLQECFAQGDIERELGQSISPLCDRHTVSFYGSQCNFVKVIVMPMYKSFASLLDVQHTVDNVEEYLAHCKEKYEAEQIDSAANHS